MSEMLWETMFQKNMLYCRCLRAVIVIIIIIITIIISSSITQNQRSVATENVKIKTTS